MSDLKDLGNLIVETIHDYSNEVKNGIDLTAEEVGKKTMSKVRSGAPERTGKYRKAISLKVEKQLLGNKKVTVYVKKPYYRLAHLLEHGHALKNGGRTQSFKHWEPAEKEAVESFVKGVSQVIENGGKHGI
ncbi:HK97 gp10 family phage protein [Erysipelothrix anatis]|uniref:HK97 gp10 family phage protein n=1 Tax=Erysipelothrix anatis TaxID=2683713 RepID=UPI00135C8084|nr:HK97 gp10 family phage protein [Erysipelothrix anatis]